jgi:hypothetical protein
MDATNATNATDAINPINQSSNQPFTPAPPATAQPDQQPAVTYVPETGFVNQAEQNIWIEKGLHYLRSCSSSRLKQTSPRIDLLAFESAVMLFAFSLLSFFLVGPDWTPE